MEWERTGRTEWRKAGGGNVSWVEWRSGHVVIWLPNLVHPDSLKIE